MFLFQVKRLTIDWDVVERVLEAESNSSRSKCLTLRQSSKFEMFEIELLSRTVAVKSPSDLPFGMSQRGKKGAVSFTLWPRSGSRYPPISYDIGKWEFRSFGHFCPIHSSNRKCDDSCTSYTDRSAFHSIKDAAILVEIPCYFGHWKSVTNGKTAAAVSFRYTLRPKETFRMCVL